MCRRFDRKFSGRSVNRQIESNRHAERKKLRFRFCHIHVKMIQQKRVRKKWLFVLLDASLFVIDELRKWHFSSLHFFFIGWRWFDRISIEWKSSNVNLCHTWAFEINANSCDSIDKTIEKTRQTFISGALRLRWITCHLSKRFEKMYSYISFSMFLCRSNRQLRRPQSLNRNSYIHRTVNSHAIIAKHTCERAHERNR